jgi:folate-dependent tRNA-U54 methylase TrmFO/GidA
MNINFGLFPPLSAGEANVENRLGRKVAIGARAARELDDWLGEHYTHAAE